MDSKKKSFAIAALRRASYRWPSRSQAATNARVARGKYKCAICSTIVGNKEKKLDHILPVVAVTGWDGFDGFIERLLCDVTGFQVICENCHARKTKLENEIRRVNKKKKKE